MTNLVVCILAIGCSVNAMAADIVEKIRCVSSSVEQLIPKDQPAEEKKVVKTELVAIREMVMSENIEVYTTKGTNTDEKGNIIYTYTSERQTKRVDLSDSQYMEISTIETKTVHSDPNISSPNRVYQLVTTYELQLDGTKKIVKIVQDGEEIELKGSDFSVIDQNGVEYTASLIDQPVDYKLVDGSVYRTELSKQICTITKQ